MTDHSLNESDREKIFKSWSGISEVALIKEVATKGEHIQLCMAYWARKRKMPLPEYELVFHDVVQAYVKRLLSERLVCKAENVLKNVQRDVRYFYYQFACECSDAELREFVLNHLRRREPHDFAKSSEDLQFHWEVLQQLISSAEILAKVRKQMRRVNLETLMALDTATQQRIMVELYFERSNTILLQRLSKFVMWDFLVETKRIGKIVRWCAIRLFLSGQQKLLLERYTELERKFVEWNIEPEMFEYAIKVLHDAHDDALRNCFAGAGFFFADERSSAPVVLRRICATESFHTNRQIVETMEMSRLVLQKSLYYLMLQNFISERELEKLADELTDRSALLELISCLKSSEIEDLNGFKQVSHFVSKYLRNTGIELQEKQVLVLLLEMLFDQPTVAKLQFVVASGSLSALQCLNTLIQRQTKSGITESLPSAYDLFHTFKRIDYERLCKDALGCGLFSSEGVCRSGHSCSNQRLPDKLTYLHYIQQSRSSYAVYYLLTEHLQHYSQITRAQLFGACETVSELALQMCSNGDLAAHCVAFCEMLGFDTQLLRSLLKLVRYFGEQYGATASNCAQLINDVEHSLIRRLQTDKDAFPLSDYKALMSVTTLVNSRSPKSVSLILQHYAVSNDYWRVLVLLHFFEIPHEQIHHLVGYFGMPTMGEHFLRSLSSETHVCDSNLKQRASINQQLLKRRRRGSKAVATSSIETMTSSLTSCNDPNETVPISTQNESYLTTHIDGCLDIFALILLNTSSLSSPSSSSVVVVEPVSNIAKVLEFMQDTSRSSASITYNLLRSAVEHRIPLLALLAASVSQTQVDVDWCWLVWLAVASNQWNVALQLSLENLQDFPWNLVEHLIRQGCVRTLLRSFCLFFKKNALEYLLRFLQLTSQGAFGDEAVHELRLYCLAWSNDEVRMPFCTWRRREKLMTRSIRLLLLHLQYNFESSIDQQKFITCVCRSGMSDISGQLDFCQLKEFCIILHTANVTPVPALDFVELAQHSDLEYARVLNTALEAKQYDVAIRLATLLQKPISNIVYAKWVDSLESQKLSDCAPLEFEQYEQEVVTHALPPEILVNFLLFAGTQFPDDTRRRYFILQRALNVIKHNHLFPNESFDRDRIEYDMIVCYLQLEDEAQTALLPVYHSEYYEQIMLHERCVLYKSFLELKELAGIEDLNIGNKAELSRSQLQRLEALLYRLLDVGDIVEALRLQELFDVRPLDLRFIVFCMALAEGISSVFSMSLEEKQLLGEIERSSFAKFNKRTLGNIRSSCGGGHLSDSSSTLEFEEIPSKEKQETLSIIQGIASKLKSGVDMAKRIICSYRAAMYLDKEYLDVLRTKDVQVLLQSVAEDGCVHKLMVVSDIFTSTHMNPQEIAELLSFEIATAVVRPRFYIFSPDQQSKVVFKNADLWGYNIDRDLHLFLELTPDCTKLGNCLLEYCDALKAYRKFQDHKPYDHNLFFERLADIIARYGLPAKTNEASPSNNTPSQGSQQVLSHKKQNIIYVELLIKAHQCFIHDCSMEGIANVLSRAKALNSVLAQAKSWSLIVRMLTGIGRYREMYFCFDTLIENEQFESLLGQFDEEKTVGLRQAILTYLREYCPPLKDKELFRLAALHFLMYKDLAEMWEQDAQSVLSKVLAIAQVQDNASTAGLKLRSNSEVISLLQEALDYYVHATENYLLDSKLLLAQKSASQAELVAMQMDLANKALEKAAANCSPLCICVIKLKNRGHFRDLVNCELSVAQALILSRAYGYDVNWSEALLWQFVVQLKSSYLTEFLAQVDISDDIIENTIKSFQLYAQQQSTNKCMEEQLAELIKLVDSVTLKYKLSSMLSLKPTIVSLINEPTIHYLRDSNFGRKDEILRS